MRNLSEQVHWFKEPEARKWKRIVNTVELSVIVLAGMIIIGVIHIYGDGTRFQPALVLFLSIFVVCVGCLTPVVYKIDLTRWKIFLIKLAFICGIGIAALSGFLILDTQALKSQSLNKAAHNQSQQRTN